MAVPPSECGRCGYAAALAEDPEKLDIYLVGAPLTRLLSEVVVGNVDIEGAAVRIPPSLVPRLEERLDGAQPTRTHRCAGVHRHPMRRGVSEVVPREQPARLRVITRPGMYVSAFSAEVILLRLLSDKGLVPDSAHSDLVEYLAEIAVEGPDPGMVHAADGTRASHG